MKYKFKIQEEDKETEEKEGMSYKKTLKSLVTLNPKWSGWIHVSYTKDINLNRKEYLMAFKENGSVKYKPITGLSTDRYVK